MDYADRFMAWPDEMTPDTPTMTDAPCGKVVALFDGRGELVLEYFTEGQEEQDVLTKLDKHVRRCRLESDDYLLYTGGLPEPDGEGRMGYRRGRFECVRRRPRAMN